MREHCGIVGLYSKKKNNIVQDLVKALFALQHRGQEGAGISLWGNAGFSSYKNFGLINEVFKKEIVDSLHGYLGIAHTRYSTEGESKNIYNIQPLTATFRKRHVAVAHNGTISNFHEVKKEMEDEGTPFFSTSDSELILTLFTQYFDHPYVERFTRITEKLQGAYSVLIQEDDVILAYRDPLGFRPLVIGENDNYVAIASETVSLLQIGIQTWKEIKPGELIILKNGFINSQQVTYTSKKEQCIFELIYFSRPDSVTFGHNVYFFRKLTGKLLAKREDHDIDIVVPVPDSGIPAALGYAEELGKPLEFGLIRSHYVGRSFIEPQERGNKVKVKLLPIKEVLQGKKIALIDDSLVRGTTSKEIIRLLRENGAREVHFRLASPPITSPCFFGIDIPTKEELMASSRTLREITHEIEADSVRYLSIEELRYAVENDKDNFCYACFTGHYNPASLPEARIAQLSKIKPIILNELKTNELF